MKLKRFIAFIAAYSRQTSLFRHLWQSEKRVWAKSILIVFSVFLASFSSANALTPTPRLKPPAPNYSNHLSDTDARLFKSGLKAAKARKWQTVAANHKKLSDQTAKDILIWIRAQRDNNARFEEVRYVMHNLGDWPRMTSIRSKAEARLFDRPRSPSETIGWFNGLEPVSGEGRIALARAYFKLGDRQNGVKWVKSAWRSSRLTRDRQKQVFKEFKSYLSKDDHDARADYLIWLGSRHFSKVDGLLSLMSPPQRALATARVRVIANRRGMDSAVNAVPRSLRRDPGLLFARANWRRRKKSKEYALPVYLSMDTPSLNEKGREKIWKEKKLMTYWLIGEKNFADAYKLTLNHGLTSGAEFAESEFLAGWLSLTKLGQAQRAFEHFDTLSNGVTFPVSLARANYWKAKASERIGDGNERTYYSNAAQYQNTFYGQLAANELDQQFSTISLIPEVTNINQAAAFEADPRVRAMYLLGEAQNEKYFTQFSFHMDDEVEGLPQLSLLSQMGRNFGFIRASVRAAKQASRFQSMLTQSGYPVIETISSLPARYDRPFVFAIARQESEFNNRAVSSANAYGMMQMINSTARATARRHGIPYSKSRLTADIDYSARLGALHLQDLLKDFKGSYIMAAAGYNAGPHRVKRWVKAYGDPRTSAISAVDWIESIPFTETRNYVQRVMENMQVYKARLNGDQHPNQLYSDITRGRP